MRSSNGDPTNDRDDEGPDRTPRVEIDPGYFQYILSKMDEVSAVDAEFARRAGMHKMEVGRFKAGATTTRRTRAICDFLRIPFPAVAIRSVEESEWVNIGRALAEQIPETFELLRKAGIEALSEEGARKRKEATLNKIRPLPPRK